MPHNRFYTHSHLLGDSQFAYIEEARELHHLQYVMKCDIGDDIEVIDGKGSVAFGKIIEIGKQKRIPYCKIEIDRLEREEKPAYPVFMALAVTRASSLDIALEKCTELGVSGFYLFPSEYTERSAYQSILAPDKKERHQLIMQSALKQSGNLFQPEYYLFDSLKEALKSIPKEHYFSDLSPTASRLDSHIDKKNRKEISRSLFIGPEKGWSKSEKALFKANSSSAIVSLSSSILRAETAAIIGCHELIRCVSSIASVEKVSLAG
ncbi:MAG: RsmE family RNA methyltransferase [Chlamydia sp.]